MKKFSRILLWLVGIFLALVVLLVVGLKLFFPVEKVRALAIEKGSAALGRNITVGDLGVTVWGGLGVQLENLTVSNPDRFGGGEMLRADYVDVKVRILPLLTGDVRVDKLIVNRPLVTLHKNADGSNNYTFASLEKETPPQLKEVTTPETRAAATTVAFDKLEVTDGYIKYTDDSTKMELTVINLDLSTSLTIPSEGVYRSEGSVAVDTILVKTRQPIPPLSLRLAYKADYDLKARHFALDEADLEANGLGLKLKGEVTLPPTPVDSAVAPGPLIARGNLKTDKVSVADLLGFFSEKQKAVLKDYKLSGDFALDVDAEYDGAKEEPLDYSGSAAISDMSISKKDIQGELKLKKMLLNFERDNLRANIEEGTFDDKPLRGHLTVENFDDPVIGGELAGGVNLSYVRPFIPAKYGQEIAGDARFNLKFSGRISDYVNLKVSGDLSVTGGRYSSALLPEPIEAFSFDVYFDNNLINVREFSSKMKSGYLNFTGRFNYLVPYLLADSVHAAAIKPSVDGNLDGQVNLALARRFLPAKGNPELSGLAKMQLKFSGTAGDYESIKPYGRMVISDAAYNDSLLPEPLKHFEAALSISPDTITVESMTAQFVSSDVTFSGKLAHPFPYLVPVSSLDRSKMKKPIFYFTLSSKKFDTDKLFPEAVPGLAAAGAPAVTADSVSMVLLPDIDGFGSFTADTVIYCRVAFDNCTGKVRISDRKIECYDVTGNVYTGRVSGKTTVDLNDFNNPLYVGEFKASQVEADDFISRFTKFGGHVFGKIDLTGSYNARGWEPDAFLNSLTMDAVSTMRDGKVVSSGSVLSAVTKLAEATGQSFQKEEPLKNVKTNIGVRDGKVRIDKLSTVLGKLGDLTLDGYYGFNGDLAYNGTILLSEEWSNGLLSKGGVAGGLAGLLGDKSTNRLKLPLSVGGTSEKPEVKIDYASILKNAKEGLLKEGAENLIEGLFKKKK